MGTTMMSAENWVPMTKTVTLEKTERLSQTRRKATVGPEIAESVAEEQTT